MRRDSMTADEFLDSLVRSRVIDAAALRLLLPEAPAEANQSGEALANWLVERQALTAFQSRRLLANGGAALVQGAYELRDVLGRGGMGTVYLAWDRSLRQYFAIKMLSTAQSNHERGILRF